MGSRVIKKYIETHRYPEISRGTQMSTEVSKDTQRFPEIPRGILSYPETPRDSPAGCQRRVSAGKKAQCDPSNDTARGMKVQT